MDKSSTRPKGNQDIPAKGKDKIIGNSFIILVDNYCPFAYLFAIIFDNIAPFIYNVVQFIKQF